MQRFEFIRNWPYFSLLPDRDRSKLMSKVKILFAAEELHKPLIDLVLSRDHVLDLLLDSTLGICLLDFKSFHQQKDSFLSHVPSFHLLI